MAKKTLFCGLLFYGCVTVCAADEFVFSEPHEEKKVKQPSLSVVTQGAKRASAFALRRNSSSSPLSPPSQKMPTSRRSSLSCLDNIPLEKPPRKSLRLHNVQLRKVFINRSSLYKNMGVIQLCPISLAPTVGDLAYYVKLEDIERSKSHSDKGKILFVPLGITGDKMYWMAIANQKSTVYGRPYYATTWVSNRTLPPVKIVHDGGYEIGWPFTPTLPPVKVMRDSDYESDESDDDEPDEIRIVLNHAELYSVGGGLHFSAEDIKKCFHDDREST